MLRTPAPERRKAPEARAQTFMESDLKEVDAVFAERQKLSALIQKAADVLGEAEKVAAGLRALTGRGIARDLSLAGRASLAPSINVVRAARAHLMKSVRLGGAATELQKSAAKKIAVSVAHAIRALDEAVLELGRVSLGDLPWDQSAHAISAAREALSKDARKNKATFGVRHEAARAAVAPSTPETT